MRVLAFETWDDGSHRSVRESIERHGAHDWTWITLPGRAWAWRMRLGAAEALAALESRRKAEPERFAEPFDAVVATSLVSLGDLRSGLGPTYVKLGAPFVLYMHENQVVYPLAEDAAETSRQDVQPAVTNLTSVLAADRVLWNSAWNRDSFVAGLRRILRHAPSATRAAVDLDAIHGQGTIAWPPLSEPPADLNDKRADSGDVTRIVWPHRWEHDKDPAALLDAMRSLPQDGSVRWVILGSDPQDGDPRRLAMHEEFGAIIDHDGYEPDRAVYWRRLAACDWVLSTARHEFFGVAVAEALRAGCLPWVPDRLSYPELLPDPSWAGEMSPHAPPEDPTRVRAAIRAHLHDAEAPVAVRRIEALIEEIVPGS